MFSLQAENEDLKHQVTEGLQPDGQQCDGHTVLDGEEDEEEEEELDVTIEGVEEDEEEEESSELWDAWDNELPLSQTNIQVSEQRKKRPDSLHLLSSSSQVDRVTRPDRGLSELTVLKNVFFISVPVCCPGRTGQRVVRR